MAVNPIKFADVLTAASTATGLTRLDDEGFVPGLQAYIRSMNDEVSFTAAGREAMFNRLVRVVRNRLRFAADLGRHPEILTQVLRPPVAIIGLPRVGSTKLQRMLAASGSFQESLFWQVFNPSRIIGAEPDEVARVSEAQQFVAWRNSTNPAANAAHHIDVHTVEEESYLLEFGFESMYSMACAGANSFYDWIQTRDRQYTYDYLAKLLRYLQWQFHAEPFRPWLLKSPPNLGFEHQIETAMPGARFIMAHRDPVTVVASVAALTLQTRRLYCEAASLDPKAIGRWALGEFSRAMKRHMEWRDGGANRILLDVAYADIEQRPLQVVGEAYAFLGQPVTAEIRASIQQWLASDRHGAVMQHEYSLELCGLTAAEIRAAFAGYIARFGRFLEPARQEDIDPNQPKRRS